jgi:cytochrome P450
MEISASSPFSKAFDHASSHVGLRFQNPLYRLTELFTGADFRSSLTEVKRFGRQIVANARNRRSRAAFESLITDTSGPSFGTLIDSLIEAFADPQVVADAALNFLSAGRDTTAQSFTWTFYALLRHSNALSDVRDEINANVKDLESMEISQLQPTNLPLTLATFHEALRLYPPVPFEIKQTNQPVTLPDGTFLPPSAIVVWCIYAFNRSTDMFGDDAHLFRPRRWLDDEGKFMGKSPFEFPVFNGGPRACLGKKMAEVMGVWVMVRFCSEWEFEEVTAGMVKVGEDGKTVMDERVSANSLTLPMEGGLPCRVKVRYTNAV